MALMFYLVSILNLLAGLNSEEPSTYYLVVGIFFGAIGFIVDTTEVSHDEREEG